MAGPGAGRRSELIPSSSPASLFLRDVDPTATSHIHSRLSQHPQIHFITLLINPNRSRSLVMTDSTAVAVIPSESSWPVPSVDELADALFGPIQDWHKADLMVGIDPSLCRQRLKRRRSRRRLTPPPSPHQIEREMGRPDTREQFLVR